MDVAILFAALADPGFLSLTAVTMAPSIKSRKEWASSWGLAIIMIDSIQTGLYTVKTSMWGGRNPFSYGL